MKTVQIPNELHKKLKLQAVEESVLLKELIVKKLEK